MKKETQGKKIAEKQVYITKEKRTDKKRKQIRIYDKNLKKEQRKKCIKNKINKKIKTK